MAAEETEFPVVMRGYDRPAVDDAIRDFRKELINITALNTQLSAELRDAQNRLLELEKDVSERENPTYAGVGAKAAQILSTAEELAISLVADAEKERAAIIDTVAKDVEQLKADGQEYHDQLVAEAQKRADRIINAAKTDYDETLAKANAEAKAIVDEAQRQAGSLRGAISTEVAKLRATAKREIEVKQSEADRSIAERKLIAERQLTGPIEQELKDALLSEQARIDLNLELTARRAEAESEYQRKYQEAVAQTQKYLDDANAQLSTALIRLSTAKLEADAIETGAKSENKMIIEEARKRADEIIANAEIEARAILSSTQAKVAQRLHFLEAEERKVKQEKSSILVYLENLTAVIEQITKDV